MALHPPPGDHRPPGTRALLDWAAWTPRPYGRFYADLGLAFTAERHGRGPEHYAAFLPDGMVLERGADQPRVEAYQVWARYFQLGWASQGFGILALVA